MLRHYYEFIMILLWTYNGCTKDLLRRGCVTTDLLMIYNASYMGCYGATTDLLLTYYELRMDSQCIYYGFTMDLLNTYNGWTMVNYGFTTHVLWLHYCITIYLL